MVADQGDAREESYYSTLETLLEEAARSFDKRKFHVTTLPKATEAGNPDFRIWDGKRHIVGYIEAKAPTVENLDAVEDSEQLRRYRSTFPNLILTNFVEFRLYRNGAPVDRALIARPFILHRLKTIPPVEKEVDFLKLLEEFYSFSLPKVYTAKNLALELAKRTSFLKDEVIAEELAEEEANGKGFIHGFYAAFRQFLIAGLSKEDFADLYAQTITYGLFAARMRSKDDFNRRLAYENIPRTIGILRDVFRFISLEDIPEQMEWVVDDIAEVLAVADVNKILRNYFREGKGKDPVIHFYETFLAAYDPRTRERRGVYYTPEAVVSYIVRSIHYLLKDRFGRADGLGSDSVTVLDPASGTLTFPAEAARLAVEEFTAKYGRGGREGFIKGHILKNFYAFELMMAPYAVGHLKMSFLLEELGYALTADDRFKLYLTNTLEMEELDQTNLPGMASLSEESRLAGRVKKEQPILAIMGNPPYSGHSANTNNWTEKLLKTDIDGAQSYYTMDGAPLGEKNPKLLQDDYVKFLRFAQWKIHKAGNGIVGMITNHGYLDNPTFRGMRQSLMKTFNELYVLDLHGNSLKKEKCPDGSKDENVFDIRQGVAITLLVKHDGQQSMCRTRHADLYGLRKDKYDWLESHDVTNTSYVAISPESPWHFFVPRHTEEIRYYLDWPSVTDIFPVNVTGIKTHRDSFVIGFSQAEVQNRIMQFRNLSLPDDFMREAFKLKDTSNWKLSEARNALEKDDDWDTYYQKILYRPFDIRNVYYTPTMVDRGRETIMRHMVRKNMALCVGRAGQVVGSEHAWNVVFCSNYIEDFNLFYRGGSSNFPLYLYPDPDHKDLLSPLEESREKKPNISKEIFAALRAAYRNEPSPEDIFHYIYAVLYSTIYRTKYAEFLKTDFPRVPFTGDERLFCELAGCGRRLADLHLMRSPELDTPVARFQGPGDGRIEKIAYDGETKRVYINTEQYFEGVEEDIWQYRIGGYQVCDKWLKDRKGNRLSLDDIRHYCRVATAIARTMALQNVIDALYPRAEENLIDFGA